MKYLNCVIILLLLTTSTSLFASDNNEFKQITIDRFDKELLKYINLPNKETEQKIATSYPALLPALAQTITNTSAPTDIFQNLKKYFSHPMLKKVYTDAVNMFNDVSKYETELTVMNKNAENELGIRTLPTFATHVSGFKENVIYTNNIISLSIDKYMGKEYSGYKGYFKPYQLQQMKSEMIVRDFAKAWLMADIIKTETTSGDLLFEMIEHGKLLYALSVLLPNYTEYDLLGYTAQEYNLCTDNHKKIWNSIVKQNHLYTIDRQIINSYFDETPTSKTEIKGLPGQIGSWIGFQIVKQYAKETKSTLKSLIAIDAKTILKDAKYRQ